MSLYRGRGTHPRDVRVVEERVGAHSPWSNRLRGSREQPSSAGVSLWLRRVGLLTLDWGLLLPVAQCHQVHNGTVCW